MIASERTAKDWFDEAARCYVEKHQGCAWCSGSHRVFRLQDEVEITYYCNCCDFRVALDVEAGQYNFIPGEELSEGPKTDFDL